MRIEKGRSIVKLHIKNWSGSELKADFEMDEFKAREVSRALYVAQTGRLIDSDREMIRRLKDSGYPEADEIAHRFEWIVGMNKLLSDELSQCTKNVGSLLNMMPDDLQKLETSK